MSRSYRKTPVNCPAHAKLSIIGKLCWKKTLRRKMNNCCDSDGTPVLPAKISLLWPIGRGGSRRRQGVFGYSSYDSRCYGIRILGGKIVSISQDDDPYPGYTEKQLRMYYNK